MKKLAKKKQATSPPPVREFVHLATIRAIQAAGAIIAKKRQTASGPRERLIAGLRGLAVLLVAGAVVFAVVKFVARPRTPPWQRLLTGEDERKAQQLMGQTLKLEADGKFAEALRVAEALAQLRERRQGADHWQARIARMEVDAIERVQGQPQQVQSDYASTFALNRQAQALGAKSRVREAQPLLEKVLAIHRTVLGEEHFRTASDYLNVAASLNMQGKYAEAEDGYRHAVALRQKVLGEDHPATAEALNDLALDLVALGRCAEAEEDLRKALAISLSVLGEEYPYTAQIYNSIAMNLNAQGKYAEAEAGYRKALAIYRKVVGEQHRRTARGYNNVAFNLSAQFKVAEAEAGYKKALDIWLKVVGEESPQAATGHNNVARNLNAQGKHAEATAGFQKALDIRQKVLGAEHPATAESYNSLGLNLDDLGKHAEAEEKFRKALAINQKVGPNNPRTATSLNNVGLNLTYQGRYAEAEKSLRQALAIHRKVLGENHPQTVASYSNVAMNLNAQGRYAEAEQLWTSAVDRFYRALEDVADSGLDRATTTAKKSPGPSLAAVLARNGKPELAWQRFEESLGRGTLDDLSTRLRRPAAEQAKEAGLIARLSRLDELMGDAASGDKPAGEQRRPTAELLTEQREVQDELKELSSYLDKTYGHAAGEVFDLKKIQAALPVFTALVGWLDLPGRPKAADPNGEHWAFLLRSSGAPVVVRLRGTGPEGAWTESDTQLPGDLRKALEPSPGVWQPLAERLGKQRLDPLKSHLAKSATLPAVRRLIVLPSAALAGVPVEVFAEGYTVSYALSGTLYARHLHESELTSNGLLALADPVFERSPVKVASRGGLDDGLSRSDDGSTLPQLPGTRAEAEALLKLSAGQQSTLLSDSLASEQKLYDLAKSGDLGKYRYLHFGTHGKADERFPLHSYLNLSLDNLPDPGKQLDAGLPVFDGKLSAEEILRQWHLNAELVTLSACETALGKYERGEGFIGFAQALILAGSRAVCLSLWEVEDKATALLMNRFYANMLGKREGLTGPMPKAVALSEAKAWLRDLPRAQATRLSTEIGKGVSRGKGRPALPVMPEATKDPGEATSEADKVRPYDHPNYWAAFVLIGDPD
jgi:CHAT domain-containing protein/tetratricopeptide (TPR) repeat protein